MYRIVQESLTNVVKHARAASVDIAVRCADERSTSPWPMTASASTRRPSPANGFGLAGMRERVELAGGELSVLPGADAGTVVRARLPVG